MTEHLKGGLKVLSFVYAYNWIMELYVARPSPISLPYHLPSDAPISRVRIIS